MNLELVRDTFTERSTTGRLLVDGAFFCYTLEDVCRPGQPKVFGRTAIPEGVYQVANTFSNRFQRYMPLLLNVPGYSGVRIHSGNKPEDTEGCILVGRTRAADFIGQSRAAYASLFAGIKDAEQRGRVTLTVRSAVGS